MKSLLRAAVRLYPPAWRERYAGEFQALIDDVHPRWRDVADVVAQAIAMRTTMKHVVLAAFVAAGALAGAVVAVTMPGSQVVSTIVIPHAVHPGPFFEASIPHMPAVGLSPRFFTRQERSQAIAERVARAGLVREEMMMTVRPAPPRSLVVGIGAVLGFLLGTIVLVLRRDPVGI